MQACVPEHVALAHILHTGLLLLVETHMVVQASHRRLDLAADLARALVTGIKIHLEELVEVGSA